MKKFITYIITLFAKSFFFLTLLIMSIFSCIDPFDPSINPEGLVYPLVVQGQITDEVIRHRIRLNRAGNIGENSGFLPEAGAIVEIIDSDSICYQLHESSNGIFYTDTVDFKAQIGKAYQLRIQLSNGEKYESDFQEIKAVKPMNTVWVRSETEPFIAGSLIRNREMLNIYTEIQVSEVPEYSRFEYEGTFAFESAYQGSDFCAGGNDSSPISKAGKICYRHQSVELPVNVYTTENFKAGPVLNQQIFSFAPSRAFAIGYSMLIKKYAITADFYYYLNEIRRQNEYGGSLFDPPPTAIEGNIRNLNPRAPNALGFFSTASLTTTRIFIDNIIFRGNIRDPLNTDACFWSNDPTNGIIRPPDFCCDCELYEGATVDKPDYWPTITL